MKSRRGYYRPRRPGSFKHAVSRLVLACGGEGEAARLLGRSRSQVHRYTDEAARDQIPAKDVLTLERACGMMIVSGFIAREQDAALLALPPRGGERRTHECLTIVAVKALNLFSLYAGRGTVDPIDGELVVATDELLSAASDLRAQLKRERGC